MKSEAPAVGFGDHVFLYSFAGAHYKESQPHKHIFPAPAEQGFSTVPGVGTMEAMIKKPPAWRLAMGSKPGNNSQTLVYVMLFFSWTASNSFFPTDGTHLARNSQIFPERHLRSDSFAGSAARGKCLAQNRF